MLRLLRSRRESTRFRLDERRTPTARLIADCRSLDLHDVRAEIAEQHRAVRAANASVMSTTLMPLNGDKLTTRDSGLR